MKAFLQLLALSLLAVDGAVASKCRPSQSASSSSSISTSSSASSSSSVISSSSSSSPIPSSSSSSIASSVSSSSAVASPSAPCVNAIVNGDFSNGFAGWVDASTGVGASTDVNNDCSTDYATCEQFNVVDNTDAAQIYQTLPLVVGVTYTMSIVYVATWVGAEPAGVNFAYGVLGAPPMRRRLRHRELDPYGNDYGLTTIWNSTSSHTDNDGSSSEPINTLNAKRAPVLQFLTFSPTFTPTISPIYLLFQWKADSAATLDLAEVSVIPANC